MMESEHRLKTDWQTLKIYLDRCYEGPPQGRIGTFTGTVLTVCILIEGDLKLEKSGHQVVLDAPTEKWVVCIPGERMQQFSNDAVIRSIHLSITSPGGGAAWRGVPIVIILPTNSAERAVNQLFRCRAVRELNQLQQLTLRGQDFDLPQALLLNELTIKFFRQLLPLLNAAGMYFEPPPIEDPRVRDSYNRLSVLDLNQDFIRQKIASTQGLSAAQLDRLWRDELEMTPRHYWDLRRHRYACEQLRRRTSSIKVIAADLGFRHLSQFSNWFRVRQGESPRSYRNRPEAS